MSIFIPSLSFAEPSPIVISSVPIGISEFSESKTISVDSSAFMFIEGTNESLTIVASGSIVCSSKSIELMVVITSSITEYFSVFT